MLGVMNAGVVLFFLNAACNQPYTVSDLFYGFKTDSKKILIISAAMMLCQAVCVWPFQYMAQNYMNTQDGKWVLYMIIAFVVGMCIYIPVSLVISISAPHQIRKVISE